MRVLLLLFAATACLGWVVPRIVTVDEVAPIMPDLHLRWHASAGFEYECRIEKDHIWWEKDGARFAPRTLTAEQLRLLHERIRNIEFMHMPGNILWPACETIDALTVTIGTESNEVRTTTAYRGPLSRAHTQFRTLIELIRKMDPPPYQEFAASHGHL